MPLAPYLIACLLAAADAVMPVVPAEVVIVGTATRLVDDPVSAAALIAVVALGSFAGQTIVFLATRRLTRHWLHGHGRWWRKIDPDPIVGRWGTRALLVAGFLPGGRLGAAASVGAGAARGPRFAVAAAIGSTLGATYLVAFGATAQRLLGTSFAAVAVAALAVALLGCLVAFVVRALPSARARQRASAVENDSPKPMVATSSVRSEHVQPPVELECRPL